MILVDEGEPPLDFKCEEGANDVAPFENIASVPKLGNTFFFIIDHDILLVKGALPKCFPKLVLSGLKCHIGVLNTKNVNKAWPSSRMIPGAWGHKWQKRNETV